MSVLLYILLFTFIGSVGGLVGGIVLLSREKFALKISHVLASFAAGILLGTAFFDLLPEAVHEGEIGNINIFPWALFGIVLFFLLERFMHHWFHHHESHGEERDPKSTTLPLIIFGDTLHNFMDGIVIAATFMTSIPLGIATTLSIFAHELPQEIGDFGLMLHKGLRPKKIILVNIFSALISIVGAMITYLLGDVLEGFLPVLLAVTAGFFIYIASSDLIPEMHHEKRKGFAFIQSALFISGILIMWISVSLLEHGH
jgi:zinc and cadmium transporter